MSKYNLNLDLIKNLYCNERKSRLELSKMFGCPLSTLDRFLHLHNVRKVHYIEDLTGKRFGKLLVIKYLYSKSYSKGGTYHMWECKCDCGKIVNVRSGNLKFNTVQCKTCVGESLSKQRRECPIDYKIWYRLKYRASIRNKQINITPEYLYDLIVKQNFKCALSGMDIGFGKYRKHENTASVDRIDSTKGYIIGNVRWVHKTVNTMKNNKTDVEFLKWCDIISQHNKKTLIKLDF